MRNSVLIVDDSKFIHELVRSHLADENYMFHSAFAGSAGIDVAICCEPDLILLDVDLPDMNGFDVCRHLKANPATANSAVIFLTASTSPDEKVCGLALKAADYITKPFDGSELEVRVRSALRVKRLLDLLPENSPAEGTPQAASRSNREGRRGQRLSLGKIMEARSKNPWQRGSPAQMFYPN